MKKHIRSPRLDRLPLDMRRDLKAARLARGWSQAELGQKVGLPQTHVSNSRPPASIRFSRSCARSATTS
jgi:hypothetical protein